MKTKNAPFDMNADELVLFAMSRLRGTGRLNDKNVDCFIDGYKACMEALYMPYKLVPVLKYHLKQSSNVRKDILDHIGYADLRRGINDEEQERIKYAEELAKILQPLIEFLEKKGE